MAKKEKTVELKPKAHKISKEHLSQLQNLVNGINAMQFNIGKIESQKHRLLHDLDGAQEGIKTLQEMLVKEYGTFDVNINDGTINWPKENKDEK